MSISIVESPENRHIEIQIRNIAKLNSQGIRKGFYYLGKDLVAESRKLINKKPKTGRVYKIRKVIGGRFVRHVASAPGEAPARITNALFNSLDFDVSGAERMEFGSKRKTQYTQRAIGAGFTVRGLRKTEIEYPKYLEEGTTKMAKRPFLAPSVKNNQKNAQEHFNREIKKALVQERAL
jgi:HK97 gp10 family phage protein